MPLSASPTVVALGRATADCESRDTNAEPSPESKEVPAAAPEVSDGSPDAPARTKRRNIQLVLKKHQREPITCWMVSEEEAGRLVHICPRAVREFTDYFRASPNACIARATRCFQSRDTTLERLGECRGDGSVSFSSVMKSGTHLYNQKASHGRERKRSPWAVALYNDLGSEFDRMRKAGVKFNRSLFRRLAVNLIMNSVHDAYNASTIDSKKCYLLLILYRHDGFNRSRRRMGLFSVHKPGSAWFQPKSRSKFIVL